jgi:predicted DNA-binding protein (MmcQ/YjbR family)
MTFDEFRAFCLSLPQATEDVQWGDDLLFRIGKKIFASYWLNPEGAHRVTFKCTPERCAELLECEGIDRAPYVGRYHWIALKDLTVLPAAELRDLVRQSYELVATKVPAARPKPQARKPRPSSRSA